MVERGGTGAPDGERERWAELGHWLAHRRQGLGISKAALARVARVSLSTVRTLEGGGIVRDGVWHPPAPRGRTLARVANALHVPPEDVFARAGRPAELERAEELELTDKLDLLSAEERGAVEAIVDHLLESR